MTEQVQEFSTVEIPFVEIDGRKALTGLQLIKDDYLADFVKRFRSRFEHQAYRDCYFLIEEDASHD